jgi:hypothetical protein
MVTHGRAREDKVFEGRRDVKAGQGEARVWELLSCYVVSAHCNWTPQCCTALIFTALPSATLHSLLCSVPYLYIPFKV